MRARLKNDARLFTTTVAVEDLDAVREALGVQKIDLVGGSYGTRVAQLTLRDRACAADPVCARRYPQDLRAQLATLKPHLAAAPVEVEYRDPATGEARREKLTAELVVGVTFMSSYIPQAAALLPVVVDEAVHGLLLAESPSLALLF